MLKGVRYVMEMSAYMLRQTRGGILLAWPRLKTKGVSDRAGCGQGKGGRAMAEEGGVSPFIFGL